MRWTIGLQLTPQFALVVGALVFAPANIVHAQERAGGTVIDLRKYQHVDGTVRPQTYIPGYKPQVAPAPPKTDDRDALRRFSDFIVVQPKQTIRTVGNLREKMSVVQGESLMGRNEFEISCSVGAAYAQIPGEEVSFRFTRQSDCKAVLQSTSVTSPCRSKLSVNRSAQTVALVGKACGAGPFASSDSADKDSREPNDSSYDDVDSLADRARSARLRARQSAR